MEVGEGKIEVGSIREVKRGIVLVLLRASLSLPTPHRCPVRLKSNEFFLAQQDIDYFIFKTDSSYALVS